MNCRAQPAELGKSVMLPFFFPAVTHAGRCLSSSLWLRFFFPFFLEKVRCLSRLFDEVRALIEMRKCPDCSGRRPASDGEP